MKRSELGCVYHLEDRLDLSLQISWDLSVLFLQSRVESSEDELAKSFNEIRSLTVLVIHAFSEDHLQLVAVFAFFKDLLEKQLQEQ